MSLYGYQPKWKPRSYLGPNGRMQANALRKARRSAPRKPRTPAQVKDSAARRLYRIDARAYIAARVNRQTCPVFSEWARLPAEVRAFLTQPWNGKHRSAKLNEIHHTHGRHGLLLNHQPWWLPVSKWGHRAIHAFPRVAREFSWLCPLGQWNKQPK